VPSLTEKQVRAAKPGSSNRKLSDGGGLQLWVTPAGGKHWKMAYRHGRPAKQKTLPLGAYPAIGIADAREAAREARTLLARGIDPNEQRKSDRDTKASSDVWTFDTVAGELIDKRRREGAAQSTIIQLRWLFELAKPFIGDRPIASITPPQVLAALQSVEGKGQLNAAVRLRGAIGAVFRFAIATVRAENDPTFALRGATASPQVKNRAAILAPEAFGAMLRAIDGFQGQPTTRACLQLLALLFPRPGELRQAEWSEFDLDKAVWVIPIKHAKMRREHTCPLPRQAIAILEEQRTRHRGDFVFPGLLRADRPIGESTLNGALRQLGYAKDEATAHGFRTTASTLLNESGLWSHDAIERALAHQDPNAVRRAYARGAYSDERVAMIQWWADYLDELRQGGRAP